MKFSVLIPTKNRLDLLRMAVQSVRNQDYDDWELIIADNCSDEDVQGFVESLGEPRIIYTRAERPVSVTENWNRALAPSTGDYVIMLGDDDALLSGYFTAARALIERYERPDLVFACVYRFAYPNVIPESPRGFVQVAESVLFNARSPYWLPPDRAKSLVDQSFNLRTPFAYNAQFSLMSRELIDRLKTKGDLYQSPYPDTYATNALFLESRRTLVIPSPMAIIGVTAKSYGFYHFNKKEKEGMDFLHSGEISADAPELDGVGLPGSQFFLCWLLAMKQLEANYGREHGLRVNPARYRYLAMGVMAKQYYAEGRHDKELIADFVSRLTARERWTVFRPLAFLFSMARLLPEAARHRLMLRLNARAMGSRAGMEPHLHVGFQNILDVQEAFPIQMDRLGIGSAASRDASDG